MTVTFQSATATAQNAPQPETFSIYFAGALFKTQDLIGNVLLGDSIQKLSNGRYSCLLPQDVELTNFRAVSIRNLDPLPCGESRLVHF